MKRKREDPEAETGTDHRPQEPGSKSNITGPAVESKQQSLQKPCGKAAGKHLRSEPVQLCNLDKARPRSADAVKSATRRQSSRLAKATASPADITAPVESIAAVDTQHQQGMAAPNSHQQAGSSPRCDDTDMLDAAPAAGEAAVPDSPEHIADGHALQQEHGHSTQQQGAGLSGAMHQQDVGAALSTEQQLHVSKGVVDSLQGDSSLAAVPVLVPGGSSRFSARYLHQKVEAKLHISKATPLGLPPTPLLPAGQQ